MAEPHDWPFERSAGGSLRPWFLSAQGYLSVLFTAGDEAVRARDGLVREGVPAEDVRLYPAEEILRIVARIQAERSALARAVAALTVDPDAREDYLDTARAGGAALWLFAPTAERADRLVRLLSDYEYGSARYYGEDGVEKITGPAPAPGSGSEPPGG
jgi:hypothetical protein